MGKYADIIDRLEKADAPDRTIDWMIHVMDGLDGVGSYGNHPAFTASLDAAIALLERMLPGHFLDIGMRPGWRGKPVRPVADIYDIDSSDADHMPLEGATPAIAVLAALFRVLAELETES